MNDTTTSLTVLSPTPRPRFAWTQAIGWLFVAGALIALAWVRGEGAMGTFSIMFVSIVMEAMPFVMLGSLIGGLIEVFLSREAVSKVFTGRSSSAAFLAALMGLVFPVCECAIIPVTRRLLNKGVPFSVAVAYLLAGPIVNPLVGASTALAYNWDWRVVAIRLGCGYVIAVIIALVMGKLFPGKTAVIEGRLGTEPQAGAQACCDHDHDHGHDHAHHHHAHREPFMGRLRTALSHAADDFLYVGQFLIIGAFVAALCQTVIDRSWFVQLAQAPWLAILLMMLLAIALNLCSEADAFVGASFRGSMPLAAQLAFLILGPMLDIKLVSMYLGFMRKRALAMLVTLIFVLSFITGMILTLWPWAVEVGK